MVILAYERSQHVEECSKDLRQKYRWDQGQSSRLSCCRILATELPETVGG